MHAPSTAFSALDPELRYRDPSVITENCSKNTLDTQDFSKRTLELQSINFLEHIVIPTITSYSQNNKTSCTFNFAGASNPSDSNYLAHSISWYLYDHFKIVVTHVAFENLKCYQMALKWGSDNLKLKPADRYFSKARYSDRFTDCKIIVGDYLIKCHKLILASRSAYFDRLFNSDDKQDYKLNLPNKTNRKAFSEVLDFIYKGEINESKTTDTLLQILHLAKHFELYHLQLNCITTLRKKHINKENVQDILEFARIHKIKDLIIPCTEYLNREMPNKLRPFDQEIKYGNQILVKKDPIQANPSKDDTLSDFESKIKKLTYDMFLKRQVIPEIISQSQANKTSHTLDFLRFKRKPHGFNKSIDYLSMHLFKHYGIVVTHIAYENQELSQAAVEWGRDNLKLKPADRFFINARNSGRFTDCKIIVGNYFIKCHKLILASRSAYFDRLFAFNKQQDYEITLPGKTNLKAFQEVLNFIYKGRLSGSKTTDNLLQILYLANYFDLYHLLLTCTELLRENINEKSVQDILEIATELKIEELIRPCNEYLKRNITKENVDAILVLAKKFKLTSLQKACEEFIEGPALVKTGYCLRFLPERV